jgi:hypothetical protein
MKDVKINESGTARHVASFLKRIGGSLSGPHDPLLLSFLMASITDLGVKVTVHQFMAIGNQLNYN